MKGKSVSAKKGKGQGVQGPQAAQTHTDAAHGKNLNFEKLGAKSNQVPRQGFKVKTPEELWYQEQNKSRHTKQN